MPPKQEDIRNEILQWSLDRPAWQRDALRRLFTEGDLTPDQLDDLADLCKAGRGLTAPRVSEALSSRHLGPAAASSESVTIAEVTHRSGANALAANQTLSFGPQLTIVYGANAAGKSGYTRILKQACRSRATEEVLGNVLDIATPGRLRATIQFQEGQSARQDWTTEGRLSDALAAVSVFDAGSAPVYLRDKTDVAFRPFGLDLFDRLSAVCAGVRERLETEKRVLQREVPKLPACPEGTRAHGLVSRLTSLTNTEQIKALATLSVEDRARLDDLSAQRRDVQSGNPKERSRDLQRRAERLELLVRHLDSLHLALGEPTAGELEVKVAELKSSCDALAALRATALTPDLLPGTGGESWRAMWDASTEFAVTAFPGSTFPVLEAGAPCPLCQQVVGKDAATRLMHFAEFVASNAQTRVREAERALDQAVAAVRQLGIGGDNIALALDELAEAENELAASIRTFLDSAKTCRDNRIASLGEPIGVRLILPAPPRAALLRLGEGLRARASQLQAQTPAMPPAALSELRELESRQLLAAGLEGVVNEVERLKRLAVYDQCLSDTVTTAITRKSTELTTRLVSDYLKSVFADELEKLEFRHLSLEVQAAGGTKGALFHRLVFKNAPGVNVTKVLSEGESRTLSLAAFLTELSTAPAPSAIIFDDPVSSLDHLWRERIARRLVAEAKVRQVIVFTHDILFLRLLVDRAKRESVDCRHQYVRREDQPGWCSPELPWLAMGTSDRISSLRRLWQDAEKSFRKAPAEYERAAREIYALLREVWEHATTEVLLNDVVERYRPTIETQRVRVLHDISEDDCKAVEQGMAECSRWMYGHDQPPADGTPFPEPDTVKQRIDDLEKWVRAIRRRRN